MLTLKMMKYLKLLPKNLVYLLIIVSEYIISSWKRIPDIGTVHGKIMKKMRKWMNLSKERLTELSVSVLKEISVKPLDTISVHSK